MQKEAHPLTSVKSEEAGGGCRKSEAPVRAMKSGEWMSEKDVAVHFTLNMGRVKK